MSFFNHFTARNATASTSTSFLYAFLANDVVFFWQMNCWENAERRRYFRHLVFRGDYLCLSSTIFLHEMPLHQHQFIFSTPLQSMVLFSFAAFSSTQANEPLGKHRGTAEKRAPKRRHCAEQLLDAYQQGHRVGLFEAAREWRRVRGVPSLGKCRGKFVPCLGHLRPPAQGLVRAEGDVCVAECALHMSLWRWFETAYIAIIHNAA